MTRQDEAWQRLVTHHLETEVPAGSDAWPRLAEELRLRRLAAGAAQSAGAPDQASMMPHWRRALRQLPRLTAGLVAASLIIATFVPFGQDDSMLTVDPTAPYRLGFPGGMAVKTAVRHSTVEMYGGSAVRRYEELEWITADGHVRRERKPLPGTDGPATVHVADGLHVWSESDGTVTVTQNRSASAYVPDWVQSTEQHWLWYEGRDPCRVTERLGVENVVGRPAHIIAVGPDRCRGSGAGENVKRTLWLDVETLVPLREVREDARTGALISVRHVHEFAVNVTLEPSVFAYRPPPHAVVRDERADRGPAESVLKLLLSRNTRRTGQRPFLPDDLAGLDYRPQWPHFGETATTLVYLPESDPTPPYWPLEQGLVIVQQDARVKAKTDEISLPPLWLAQCAGGIQVERTIERTRITLCSPNVPEATLRTIAESFAPVDGGYFRIMVGDSTLKVFAVPAPAIEEVARNVDYRLFVPQQLPDGLVPVYPYFSTYPFVPTTTTQQVRFGYQSEDGAVIISITMAPAGGALDLGAGARPVTIRDGLTGYAPARPVTDSGPVVWWIEEGTIITMSAEGLTEQQLLDIAASMISVD